MQLRNEEKIPGKGNDKTEHWGKGWERASSALSSTMDIDSTALAVPPPFWSSGEHQIEHSHSVVTLRLVQQRWIEVSNHHSLSDCGTTWGWEVTEKSNSLTQFPDTFGSAFLRSEWFKLIFWALNRCANIVSVCFWRKEREPDSEFAAVEVNLVKFAHFAFWLHWGKTKYQKNLSKIFKILVFFI